PRPVRRSAYGSAAEPILDREVTTAVERALAALPVSYRQVLTLRLVHDLSPTAIAHALGCPPNTVKTRLKRGLALLRRHLPAGIATSVALLLATGRGLAAVRADVMLQAGRMTLRAAKATAWALPLGVLFMKTFLLRVGLLVPVLLLAWLGVDAMLPGPVRPETSSGGAIAVATVEPVRTAAEGSVSRSEVTPPPAWGTAKVVLHGRCIDATTGRPIPGLAAGAWPVQPDSARLPCEDDLALALDHTLTDADGVFRLACDPSDAILRVHVRHEGLQERLGLFGPFPAPQDVDCGDLPMHTGVVVSTRVVDQRGQAVGGVAFVLSRGGHDLRDDEPLMERPACCVRTRADGTVPWCSALAPGRYEVKWHEDAIPPQRKIAEMVIPAGIASLENQVLWPVEDERQALRGIVTDEDGRAVDGVELYAEGAGTRGHGRCGCDGRFVIPRIGPYDDAQLGPVTISINKAIDGYELVGAVPCTWGSQDLRLVVRTAQALAVHAVDARTGQPLRAFAINCAVSAAEGGETVIRPRSEPLADGGVRLCIARMPHLVQVLPEDPALAPSDIVRWEPSTGDELTVVVKPTKTIEIVLSTGLGEPVAGSEVWTMQPMEGATPAAPLHDVPLPNPFQWGFVPAQRWMVLGYGIDDTPLDHGTSDAAGRVRLRAPTDTAVLIAARGPGHVPRTVVTTPDERIDLRVQRGASVRFDLFPPELVPHFLPSARDAQVTANREAGDRVFERNVIHLAATRARREQDPEHAQPTVSTTVTSASCTCDGLAPGTWDLQVYGMLRRGCDRVSVHGPLATVTLQAGEQRVVPVDLRRWATGRVRGQVLVNGRPWAFEVGTLQRSSLTDVEVHTDAEGRFEADMVAGVCRFHLRSLFDHSTYWCAPEPCTVVAGTTVDVVIDVRRVAAHVQIVTAGDQPAARLRVAMACATEPHDYRTWTTDAYGCVTIDPAPLSGFELVATCGDEPSDAATGVSLGPMQVPLVGTTAEFHLRLPESWR
ncbi:MAG TPA: sigma-70 family RNA polymerase sigma factor, partial [Planctomycetota bacterium]|nr:sigma-70 family RNA polymerase sigma factor [Planctomycetota bacterium]